MADFEDHFVAGSDVALENHTPDTTGTAWTLQRDGHDILAVEDFASNSAAGAISTSDAIGTEDYEVQSDIRLIGAADRTGIGARFTDLSNSLHVRIKSTDDEMEMEKVIGGTRTALAISTAIRNVGLGLLIVNNNFPGTPAVALVLVFGALSMVIAPIYGKLMDRLEA